MVRISSSTTAHRRKKRILTAAKGQFGQRSRRYKQAKISVVKGLTYQYRDRKVNKRMFRSLWIIRINAACREIGISYSRFIAGLLKANIALDRKMLSELAISSPGAFRKLVVLAGGPDQE
jgi:large subunit ribosomal protein L20